MSAIRQVISIIKELIRKYNDDNGYIIVSSICFYIILTFIPFTLLSMYILGYVIDISNAVVHLTRFLQNIVPKPYDDLVVRKVIGEVNLISTTRGVSGPLGLISLFFFTMRIFAILRPSFRIIFRTEPKGFIRGKGQDLFLTVVFSVIQAVLFFSFVFTILIQTRVTRLLPGFISKSPFLYAFSGVDMLFTFAMVYLLYYFLSPIRKNRAILIATSIVATLFWYLGKALFQLYILHVGRLAAFMGTYGVVVAVLFWVYFSVFVFIVCAELQSVLISRPIRGLLPSSGPSRERP